MTVWNNHFGGVVAVSDGTLYNCYTLTLNHLHGSELSGSTGLKYGLYMYILCRMEEHTISYSFITEAGF